MMQLLLIVCFALPIAWLASETHSRRWISVVLGIAALVAIGFLSYVWGSFITGIEKNLYFGESNAKLVKALSEELELGNSEHVRRELGRFAKNFHPSYENSPRYDEEVDTFVLRLNEANKADTESSTSQDSEIVVEGTQVSLSGIYHIAGKFGPYIQLGETSVYLVSDQSASWPDFDGKRVEVSGSLRLEPAGVSTSDEVAVPPARLLLTTTPDTITVSEEK